MSAEEHVEHEHHFHALVGEDGEVHCAEVLERVNVFIDHELADADSDTIREHLAACEPCLDQFDVADAVKRLVRRCCVGEQAPATLRLRVLQVVAETGEDPLRR
ncbi:mycothiol system anti-sigma-R factor [Desertihabitans aurantiacus]|uniref:mycothiol system anti-sigma-R factor n=1 Tax=Desertihabitans aurantiacus TaxID=2282477 RepID=UPI000DF808C1|nr:mycothiol system anti-sigma-R factor [Desertihabitans aurantiacus]